MELEYHPIAEDFPKLPSDELRALARDIKANGLHEPIWLFEGKILDGRHRYQACLTEGVEPRFIEYEGGDPVAFVESMNYHRRHLTREEKRARAKEMLRRNPDLSSRAIGREVGVHHRTVEAVRHEVEEERAPAGGNGEIINSDFSEPLGDPDTWVTLASIIEDESTVATEQAAKPPARVEKSGKKARGRRAGVKSAATDKPAKPKNISNDGDRWMEDLAGRIKSNTFATLSDIVRVVDGLRGIIQINCSDEQCQGLGEKWLVAIGVVAADLG